jgi:hypothetical protein
VSEDVDTRTEDETSEPGLESIRITQCGKVPPGPKKALLDRVSRELVVPEDESGRRVQPRDEQGGKDGEGVAIASLCSLDEFSLVHVDLTVTARRSCRAREVCRVETRKGSRDRGSRA